MTLRENEWFIKVPWGRICIVAWGNCLNPPVLLVHGGSDTIASWRPLVKLLPDNFYYVGMEFPGCGKSDPYPPGIMINAFDLVYTIDAVAQHFRWDSFGLIGHSMGAYVGKMYNISVPDKISRLIEIDPINFVGVPPENFSHWYKLRTAEFYDNMDKYNISKDRSSIKWEKALENIKKRRQLPEDVAVATLERLSEPVGNGSIRYTLDPRYKLMGAPPLTPEQIKQLFTTTLTPTLIIAAKSSYERGLYRNTIFLLDENEYVNRNMRCKFVDGLHDVHAITPEVVATFVGPFLVAGVNGVDTKSKL